MNKRALFWLGGTVLVILVLALALNVCPFCQRPGVIPVTGQLPQDVQPGTLPAPSGEAVPTETPTIEQSATAESQLVDPAAVQSHIYIPLIRSHSETQWPMLAGNPQRTSWSPEQVNGRMTPIWYKPIEPLIPIKSQLIAGYGNLYVSTARGLYAIDATTGSEKWVFPTELPLGNSPTLADGVLYVAGLDHRVYALDPATGKNIWTFEAAEGFDTNPLVVQSLVLLGSRDGNFYAIRASNGQLAWKYSVGAPIHYSAAYSNGIVYFAADNDYAYALEVENGSLEWQSTRMVGAGFHSWWPVVYQNYLVLTGGNTIRHANPIGNQKDLKRYEYECIFGTTNPSGDTPFGPRQADGSLNMTKAMQCYESYPWRRTFFVLDIATGKEVTFDLDQDNKPEYAPLLWFGTYSGNRFPPVVMPDGIMYTSATFLTNSSGISRGMVAGWRFGTPYITTPGVITLASDEPIAYAAGGNIIYWNQCCNRSSGAVNVSLPNKGVLDPAREWIYLQYDEVDQAIPGYNEAYYHKDIDTAYGGANGAYGLHGDQSAPIPYNGRIYIIYSNTIVAYGKTTSGAVKLAKATTRTAPSQTVSTSVETLKQLLTDQVTKIINAGHLRAGFAVSGNFDLPGTSWCGDYLMDYSHEPSDSIITLLRALPYLPANLQTSVKTYVTSEFTNYAPYRYTHIGFQTGAAREYYPLPKEMTDSLANFGAQIYPNSLFDGWDYPPMQYYALWKYAQVYGNAKAILANTNVKVPEAAPSDALLAKKPNVHNAFISGYWGYLELQKLAGVTENSAIRSELNRLLALRVNTFTKDSVYGKNTCTPGTMNADCYCKVISVSQNFMNLTPELGDYLHDNATSLPKVQQAITEYNRVAPYWFVAHYEQTYGEGVIQPIYDSYGVFQARALILQQPFSDLSKYIDVPIFEKGDFYYIQNLVSAIEASTR